MILLFIRAAILGDMISQAIFNILGPSPSRPVDVPGSSLRMKSATCDVVMSGILKSVVSECYNAAIIHFQQHL